MQASPDKNHLRESALLARAALGRDVRAQKSAAIVTLLRNWELYRQAQTICLYASFGSEVSTRALFDAAAEGSGMKAGGAEDTDLFATKEQGTARPEVQAHRSFCLPRVEGSGLVIHRLELSAWIAANGSAAPATSACANGSAVAASDATVMTGNMAQGWPGLVRSVMGMPEPPAIWPVMEPQALDIILVPGSAFSASSGHRLGYGKGFYDRLLPQAPQALKVGLCFDVQLFSDVSFPVDAHDVALDVLISESGIRDLRV